MLYNEIIDVTAQYRPSGHSAAEIAADVEAAIRRGQVLPGQQLPPIRVLAEELGAAHVTVAAAYRRLGERGLVIAGGRAGTRVAEQPPLPVRVELELPAGVSNLADGNPDPRLLPPLPRLRPQAIAYGHASVEPELANILRADFAADGVNGENMTLVGGALDGIERVLAAQLLRGDRVAVEDPGFPRVHDLVAALGFRLQPLAVDQRGITQAALREALEAGVTAVIVTPRAQNPTGAALDEERASELRRLLAGAPDVLTIEDDHAAAVADAPFHSLAGGRRRWAVVRSLSKAYGPDLRLAALAADEETAARVAGRLRLGTGWISHILQRLALETLRAPDRDARIERARATYRDRRDGLVTALAAEGIEAWGRSGLNVWVPVAEETVAVRSLLDAGYAVAAGERYRLRSGPAVRVTIARLGAADAQAVAAAISRSQRGGSETAGTVGA